MDNLKKIRNLSFNDCEIICISNYELEHKDNLEDCKPVGCNTCPLHIKGGYCYKHIKEGIRDDLKKLKSTELSLNEKKTVLEQIHRSIKRAEPYLDVKVKV